MPRPTFLANPARRALIALAAACLVGLPGRALAVSFTLDYSQINVLPSATGQGLTFNGSAGVTESAAFSVSGGALQLNTTQYGPDVYAYYDFAGGYDSSLDARMVVRVAVEAASRGLQFGFYDPIFRGLLVVNQSSWEIYQFRSGSLPTTSDYREFDLRVKGGTGAYELYVDGNQVSTGTLPGGYPNPPNPPIFYFGDASPTGLNVRAAFSYIHYENQNAPVVPEPSSWLLLGLGGLAAAGVRARRVRRAG